MQACTFGNISSVQFVLEQGAEADVNALFHTCANGHSQCVELLLRHGVNADYRDVWGKTALMTACANGHSECVERLLKHGVNADDRDVGGDTALMTACTNGHSQCVELLLKHGVNADDWDVRGDTALIMACAEGQFQCLELLLRYGVNADDQDDYGSTALMNACEKGHSECVELLLKHGVNADDQDDNGNTALMNACEKGHSECVELLLKHGVNVEARTSPLQYESSALMFAVAYLNPLCVELLLDHGVDVGAQETLGTNALYYACHMCDLESIHLLLEAKADLHQCERSAMDNVFGINLSPEAAAHRICKASRAERRSAAFLLMCNGYDLKKCSGSHAADVRGDYQRAHQLLEERFRQLLAVLGKEVKTDRRIGLKENGIYHEPLERVLEYSGMHLTPRVLNKYEDMTAGRVLLTGSLEASKMAFDRFLSRVCTACRATTVEPMKQCSCKSVWYCSVECQVGDQTAHEAEHINV